jgi:hypothetical protein
MLAALGVDVVALRDLFPEPISDVELYSQLDPNKDVLITYDHRQKTREAEAMAIKESGVTALWLGPLRRNFGTKPSG